MSRGGLATERTALAWRRTAIAATFIGVLFLNRAVVSGWGLAAIVPVGAALTMSALAGLCYLRNRVLRHGRSGHDRWVVVAATTAVVITALLAAAADLADLSY